MMGIIIVLFSADEKKKSTSPLTEVPASSCQPTSQPGPQMPGPPASVQSTAGGSAGTATDAEKRPDRVGAGLPQGSLSGNKNLSASQGSLRSNPDYDSSATLSADEETSGGGGGAGGVASVAAVATSLPAVNVSSSTSTTTSITTTAGPPAPTRGMMPNLPMYGAEGCSRPGSAPAPSHPSQLKNMMQQQASAHPVMHHPGGAMIHDRGGGGDAPQRPASQGHHGYPPLRPGETQMFVPISSALPTGLPQDSGAKFSSGGGDQDRKPVLNVIHQPGGPQHHSNLNQQSESKPPTGAPKWMSPGPGGMQQYPPPDHQDRKPPSQLPHDSGGGGGGGPHHGPHGPEGGDRRYTPACVRDLIHSAIERNLASDSSSMYTP